MRGFDASADGNFSTLARSQGGGAGLVGDAPHRDGAERAGWTGRPRSPPGLEIESLPTPLASVPVEKPLTEKLEPPPPPAPGAAVEDPPPPRVVTLDGESGVLPMRRSCVSVATRALLDTSVVIALARGESLALPDPPDEATISVVTLCGLHRGVLVAQAGDRAARLAVLAYAERTFKALTVDERVAPEYGRISERAAEAGRDTCAATWPTC